MIYEYTTATGTKYYGLIVERIDDRVERYCLCRIQCGGNQKSLKGWRNAWR